MGKNLVFLGGLLGLVALGSLLLIATGAWASATTSGQPAEEAGPMRANFSLPRMINFESFKRQFKKHYKSLGEELSRKFNFMPRAMRAIISSVRYKHGQDSSYKKVNEMSDWTKGELERMENKLLEGSKLEAESGLANAQEQEQEAHLALAGPAAAAGRNATRLEAERRALIEALDGEGASSVVVAAVGRSRRRKRDTSDAELVWHKIRQMSELEAPNELVGERAHLNYESTQLSASKRPTSKPDELFVDHRQTSCLAEPRHQGSCGCCYAFAIVSIMEYQICMQTGRLTPLSEQYLVDCAKGRYGNRVRGCSGAMVSAVGNFVHDFGLHTRKRYPFVGHEQECPFDLDGEPKARAGRIRVDLGDAVHIHQDHWEQALERGGPLMVHAAIYRGMVEYGGGIDQARGCRPRPSHEMVLVGHGRADGQHYWLIRNSYGTSWGEQGYWRLAKSSAARCMGKYGEAFGTRDGINFTVRARLNRAGRR